MEKLKSNIVEVAKRECAYDCTVLSHPDRMVVQISNDDFDWRIGDFIVQLQKAIDRHYPEKEENLFLICLGFG